MNRASASGIADPLLHDLTPIDPTAAGAFGLLRDPGEWLGMLYGQRWRAARIVIDMGLRLGLPIPAGNGPLREVMS